MFKVLVADPTWPFDDKLPDNRGAESHYKTMLTMDQIFKFPLPPLAPDCTLFLWRVASMQQEALNTLFHWGFELKSEIVWVKKTKTGKRWFGMGRTVRGEHEVCLIAHRGNPQTLNRSVRSIIETDFDVDGFEAPYTGHSAKPELFFDIVELFREGPYCELFARRERHGWTCIGDEITHGLAR